MLRKFYYDFGRNAYLRIPSSLVPVTNNSKVTKYVYLQKQIKSYLGFFWNIAFGGLVLALASKKLPQYLNESGIVLKLMLSVPSRRTNVWILCCVTCSGSGPDVRLLPRRLNQTKTALQNGEMISSSKWAPSGVRNLYQRISAFIQPKGELTLQSC